MNVGNKKTKVRTHFQNFYYAFGFVVCSDAVTGSHYLKFLKSIKGLGWEWIGM